MKRLPYPLLLALAVTTMQAQPVTPTLEGLPRSLHHDLPEAADRATGGGTATHIITVTCGNWDTAGDCRNPVFYRVEETGEEGSVTDGRIVLQLPGDDSITVRLAAWEHLAHIFAVAPATPDATIEHDVELFYDILYDDAEFDLGWQLSSPDDDATAGGWARAMPRGVRTDDARDILVEPDLAEDYDANRDSTAYAFLTAPSPSASRDPEATDVDGGKVTMTSPLFDLTNGFCAVVTFGLWYSNDAKPGVDPDDTLVVQLSNDRGQTWHDVERLSESTNGWQGFSFQADHFDTQTEEMMMRIVASDYGNENWVEAGFDQLSMVYLLSAGNDHADRDFEARLVGTDRSGGLAVLVESERPIRQATAVLYGPGGDRIRQLFSGDIVGELRLPFEHGDLASGQYYVVLQSKNARFATIPLVIRR